MITQLKRSETNHSPFSVAEGKPGPTPTPPSPMTACTMTTPPEVLSPMGRCMGAWTLTQGCLPWARASLGSGLYTIVLEAQHSALPVLSYICILMGRELRSLDIMLNLTLTG